MGVSVEAPAKTCYLQSTSPVRRSKRERRRGVGHGASGGSGSCPLRRCLTKALQETAKTRPRLSARVVRRHAAPFRTERNEV